MTESDPGSYLPGSTDGWEFRGTSGYAWEPLGATDGTIGHYTGPDGTAYDFVVMDTQPQYAEGTARSLACAGWQIVLEIHDNPIAASTGTEQRTFTPEEPPTMTKSPLPDSEDEVRKLLTLSPRLSESDIDTNRVECDE